MNFNEALFYLLSLGHETLTIKLGLANTETLLDALGNPQKDFPAVQIAGTNGKGSTAVMLDSICRAAGIRTGLFTSPHLVSITERIHIQGEPIAENDFARLTTQVKETAEKLRAQGKLEALPTFFEHLTAIALLAFQEAKVDLVILETGLGGRLDSTTVAGASIVAITPIAMDHEEYLGHSLAEIAAEKAAIIRAGVTAIVAPQEKAALAVILEQCKRQHVQPRLIEPQSIQIIDSSADGRCRVSFETVENSYQNELLGLRGRHQAMNAAVAVSVAESLREGGFDISLESIVSGLENATHPGRLELWEGKPPILFDGAHNPAAARALREYLDEFVKQPITMIFGAMRDKALSEMGSILFPPASKLILTELENPRAAMRQTLSEAAEKVFDQSRTLCASSPREAMRMATEITQPTGIVVVTGSLYLVGAARQLLNYQGEFVARHYA